MAIVGDSATAALQTVLEERLDELADEAAGRILSEIPAYRSADAQMRRDVRAHVRAHLTASIGSLGDPVAVQRARVEPFGNGPRRDVADLGDFAGGQDVFDSAGARAHCILSLRLLRLMLLLAAFHLRATARAFLRFSVARR